jgi:hypothetical protein
MSPFLIVMLRFVVLIVVMLNVFILNVVAPNEINKILKKGFALQTLKKLHLAFFIFSSAILSRIGPNSESGLLFIAASISPQIGLGYH